MVETLYERYYQYYNGYLISSILFGLVLILIIIFHKRILSVFSKSNLDNIKVYVLMGIVLILLGGTVYFGINLYNYSKDLSMVKQEEYIVIEAEMIRYTIVREGNDPNEPNEYMPLFRILSNGENIKLNIIDTLIEGESYVIYYLPNCKLGVIEHTD